MHYKYHHASKSWVATAFPLRFRPCANANHISFLFPFRQTLPTHILIYSFFLLHFIPRCRISSSCYTLTTHSCLAAILYTHAHPPLLGRFSLWNSCERRTCCQRQAKQWTSSWKLSSCRAASKCSSRESTDSWKARNSRNSTTLISRTTNFKPKGCYSRSSHLTVFPTTKRSAKFEWILPTWGPTVSTSSAKFLCVCIYPDPRRSESCGTLAVL